MRIGITERGDAGLDLSWALSLYNRYVDGAVLITKNVNERFIRKVMELYDTGGRIIVHAGCTGWGHTAVEPGAPDYQTQIAGIMALIKAGFPRENIVLRIDPIFPNQTGLARVADVLDCFFEAWYRNDKNGVKPRIRVSILDEYSHVKARIKAIGFEPVYPDGAFQCTTQQMQAVTDLLFRYRQKAANSRFETCAEHRLCTENQDSAVFLDQGCISAADLAVMGFDPEEVKDMAENPQNRTGCRCLACKTELLPKQGCHQCPHRCVYCYWKDDYDPKRHALPGI